jgi:hypothetical protein
MCDDIYWIQQANNSADWRAVVKVDEFVDRLSASKEGLCSMD